MKKLFVKKFSLLLCLTLLISCFCLLGVETVTAAATQDAKLGALKVEGANLCDKNGNVVQLKGVSTHGLSWYPGYVNDAFLGELHDTWNANVVRLAMYTAEYNGYCAGDSNNKKNLEKLILQGVEYAKNHDLYVIVDWHILSDGNPLTNVTDAKAFWELMAKTLAPYDNVIYEICNEPNGSDTKNGGTWENIKSYANQIIPIIRNYDADSVIVVGTPTWSQEVDKAVADPLKYDNVMYSLHFYAGTHKQSLRDTAEEAIKAGLPIFVTEFGICDASGNGSLNKNEGNSWITLLDKYKVSYVAWNLSNKNESSALFKSSCSKYSGFAKNDLSDAGQWYMDVLGGKVTDTSKNDSSTKKTQNETKTATKNATIKVKQTSFTVYRKSLSKAKTLNPAFSVNGKGKLTYKKSSGSKYLSVTSAGKVSVKAKTPKGTYKIKVQVKSAATSKYKAASKTVTVTVRVK